MSTAIDYEQAGELKIGQVGVANLRVRTLDVAQLAAEMRDRVQRAPKLFERAAVILDFGGLTKTPDADTARKLALDPLSRLSRVASDHKPQRRPAAGVAHGADEGAAESRHCFVVQRVLSGFPADAVGAKKSMH